MFPEEDITNHFAERGLDRLDVRIRIARAAFLLSANGTPLDADRVLQHVNQPGQRVGYAVVSRTLYQLQQAGFIVEQPPGHLRWAR